MGLEEYGIYDNYDSPYGKTGYVSDYGKAGLTIGQPVSKTVSPIMKDSGLGFNSFNSLYEGVDLTDNRLSNLSSIGNSGNLDSSGLIKNPISGIYSNPNTTLEGSSGGMVDWLGNQDWGVKGLGGTLLGAGQLGLGLASYFDQKKTAKKQRRIMDQQIAQNKYTMEKDKANDISLSKAFGV